MIEILINNIKEYFGNFSPLGIIKGVIDLALVIIVFIVLLIIIAKRIKRAKFYFYAIGLIVCYIASVLFSLNIFNLIMKYLIGLLGIILVIIHSQEIRYDFDNKFAIGKTNNSFDSDVEKQEIIDVLCDSCEFLSRRKIGALITIERNDNLNSLIEKAIPLNSTINQEILTTIFYPGTACHDGAVIIRKNKIMCAGAYLPSTDKYDIPKNLGTRHRAAIGLSERYDALTIVVSEETGNISIALNGNMRLDLKRDSLKETLDSFLEVK